MIDTIIIISILEFFAVLICSSLGDLSLAVMSAIIFFFTLITISTLDKQGIYK